VAQVEAVGVAALQRHQVHRQLPCIGVVADGLQHRMADAAALVRRVDVQVVQLQRRTRGLQHHEAGTFAVDHDVLRGAGVEARGQALARTLLVVAAQPFQAVAHGAQAQGQQRLEVVDRGRLQRERHRHHRHQPC
jgi:hypothetical protein